jgi:site-specific DNA-methyltransferase (adenine-specific)
MSMAVHFSSASDDWATPMAFFEKVAAEFGPFDLDVCASAGNAKAAKFFDVAQDGLAHEWAEHGSRIWMNPPYGRTIGKWVKKAFEAGQRGALVVCLVPARTDTVWWHDYCMQGGVTFIRGRLKFGNAKHAAPFPSALVVFGQKKAP